MTWHVPMEPIKPVANLQGAPMYSAPMSVLGLRRRDLFAIEFAKTLLLREGKATTFADVTYGKSPAALLKEAIELADALMAQLDGVNTSKVDYNAIAQAIINREGGPGYLKSAVSMFHTNPDLIKEVDQQYHRALMEEMAQLRSEWSR